VRNKSREGIKEKVNSSCREKEGNMAKEGKMKGMGKEYERKKQIPKREVTV
jgi:hypothetical protein